MSRHKKGLEGPKETYTPLGSDRLPPRNSNDPGGDGWILIASLAGLGIILAFLLIFS